MSGVALRRRQSARRFKGRAIKANRFRGVAEREYSTDIAGLRGISTTTISGPVIEVFADIWCPFSHVGLKMIEERRAYAGRTDMAIWVRAWPLELVNGAPLDSTKTREHAEDLRDQVAPNLFQHLDMERFPRSTIGALALANRAYRTAPDVGERISFALRNALFEEGLDVSDHRILRHLAHDHGVSTPDDADRADVMADWLEGQRRGVLGSPHFFCGETNAFCPSLDITKDPVDGVTIVFNATRLTDFLDRCFSSQRAKGMFEWPRGVVNALASPGIGVVSDRRNGHGGFADL